jgi:hypothetical protein
MAYHTNLAMQTFSSLFLVIHLEHLLQTLHSYFTFTKKTSKVYKAG